MEAQLPLVLKCSRQNEHDSFPEIFVKEIRAVIEECETDKTETDCQLGIDILETLREITDVQELMRGQHTGLHGAGDVYNKKLYGLYDDFLRACILTPTTASVIHSIQNFSSTLLKYDSSDLQQPTLAEKYLISRLQNQVISRLGKQNISREMCTILSSTSAMLIPIRGLKTSFPSSTFELIRRWLSRTEINLAHKSEIHMAGNLAAFHTNVTDLIATKPTTNIHQAVSKILFGSRCNSEIIQLSCYHLLRDGKCTTDCVKWTNKSISSYDAKINSLLNIALPNQLSLAILSRVIERNIILHVGSYSGGTTSLKFGTYPDRIPVEILELNKKLYPLLPVEGGRIRSEVIKVIPANQCLPSQREWSLQDPSHMNFGEFGESMKSFFQVCSFCKDFGIRSCFENEEDIVNCLHISVEQVKAFVHIRELLLNKRYGNLEEKDIPIQEIDADNMLPGQLSEKFCMVETQMDGQCLFSATSYALTKQFDLGIPLRRCTQVEYRLNSKIYGNYYEEGRIPMDEINDNNKVVNSLSLWGNSFSLALLSRITRRKIVVYESEKNHITYDVSPQQSKNFRPIFLFLSNNHFQPLIPKRYDSGIIPSGKDTQYKLINELEAERSLSMALKSVIRDNTPQEIPSVLSNLAESSPAAPSFLEQDIKKQPSVSFPWNRPITENDKILLQSAICNSEKQAVESPLSIVVNDQMHNVSIDPMNNNLLKQLNLTIVDKIPAAKIDDFNLYTNCIIDDIRRISKTDFQEDFIRVFVQRCTFKTFWESSIVRVKGEIYKKKNPKKVQNIAKKMLTCVQTCELARELTIEILFRSNFSAKSLVLYSNIMQARMSLVTHAKSRTANLKADLLSLLKSSQKYSTRREYPEYNFDGLAVTKVLEEEMKNKMDFQVAKELDCRIENMLLPDAIGKVFLDKPTHDQYLGREGALKDVIVDTDNSSFNITMKENMHDVAIQSEEEQRFENIRTFEDIEFLEDNDTIMTDVNVITNQSEEEESFENIGTVEDIEVLKDNDTPMTNVNVARIQSEEHKKFENDKTVEDNQILEDKSTSMTDESGDKDSFDSECSEEEESEEAEDLKIKEELVKDMFPAHVLNFVPPKDFTLTISGNEMAEIFDYDANKFRSGKWTQVISHHISNTQGACCFKTRHVPDYYSRKSSGFSVMSGYCGCKLQFTVKLFEVPQPGQPVTLEVKSHGKFRLIQTRFCGRQLRGDERKIIGEKLVHNMPSKVLLEHIASESPLHLLHNTTKLYSLESLQQLRHSTLRSSSICLDPMSDLLAFKKETELLEKDTSHVKGFIHLIKESEDNVQIHMYTEMALRLLKSSQRDLNSMLFVDATSSITFPVNKKQMMFYLAFLETSKGHIAPICTSLGLRGRASDIADLFIKVKADLKQINNNSNKPLAGIIVTDFSFAMLTGVLQGANTMELRDYIVHASNVIMDRHSFDPQRSVVFICTSHLIHSFSRLLRKHVPGTNEYKAIRQLAMHSMARLQSCKDLRSFQLTVTKIIECFSLKTIDEEKLQENVEYLKGEIEDETEDNQDVTGNEESDMIDFSDHELLREKSPFYQEFLQIKTSTLAHEDSSKSENKFYLPVISDLFQKYYCPYFCLFSAAILNKTGRHDKGTITNGIVESEFNSIKNLYHHKLKLPFNLFIRGHYTYFTGRIKEVFLPESQRHRRIEKKIEKRESRYQREEKFSKTKRKKTNRYVKKNSLQLKRLGKDKSPKCNTDSPQTKYQTCDIIHRKVKLYSSNTQSINVNDLNNDGSCGTSPANNFHSDTSQSSAQKEVMPEPLVVNIEANTRPQEKQKIAQNVGNTCQPTAVKVPENFIPKDELAIVPYNALKIGGQSFDTETVSFRSKQLAELCNPKSWIEFDIMDRLLQYAKSLNLNSKFTVSETHFAWKQRIDDANCKSDWQSLFKFDETPDESRCVDPRKSNEILHPLFMNNHWCLLKISKRESECVVYDSMYRDLGKLQELLENVLPLFQLPDEHINWKIYYANDFPVQHDSSSCGLYTYEACRLLLNDQEPTSNKLQHLRGVRKFRISLVIELLQTTYAGKLLLSQVGYDDDRLERTLYAVHTIFQEQMAKIAEEKKCISQQKKRDDVKNEKPLEDRNVKENETCRNSGHTPESPGSSSKSCDIRKKTFQEIYHDPNTATASVKMLAAMATGTLGAKMSIKGSKNVKELMRRMDQANTKKNSKEGMQDDLESNIKQALIPNYLQKKELYEQHCRQIKSMGIMETRKMIKQIMPEMRKIMDGKIICQRNQIYRKAPRSTAILTRLAIVKPFSDLQDFEIAMYLHDILCDENNIDDDDDYEVKNFRNFQKIDIHYINYVLKPEAMIRIYASKCDLSLELAEKELRFGPDYE